MSVSKSFASAVEASEVNELSNSSKYQLPGTDHTKSQCWHFLLSFLPQVSNPKCSSHSSHLAGFHGCGEASWSPEFARRKTECDMKNHCIMCAYRPIFGANDWKGLQGCRLFSEPVDTAGPLSWTKDTVKEELCHLARFVARLAALALTHA